MALVKCSYCGGMVSDAEPSCVHCGAPAPREAPAPAPAPAAPPPPVQPAPAAPKSGDILQQTWFIVAMLFFCYPFGLIAMWTQKGDRFFAQNKGWKIGLTALFALMLVFGMFSEPAATRAPGTPGANADAANPVTLAVYRQLQEGMTDREVAQLVGREGVETARRQAPAKGGKGMVETVTRQWSDGGAGSMTAVFQNDRLVEKRQTGLR